jgi:hypothetical protein
MGSTVVWVRVAAAFVANDFVLGSFRGRRDLVSGLERRDRMLAKGQLATYSVQYWDEPFSVGIDFTRAVVPPRLHCSFRLEDERTFGYEAALTEAVFDVVRRGLGVAPARESAVETWLDDDRQVLGLLLDAGAVERLGGIDAVVADAPAVSVEQLDGPAAGGALVRLAATPGSLTPDRHRRALDYLAPLTLQP